MNSVQPTGASPIGAPGWPLFAFWTASIASVRTVVMLSSGDASVMATTRLLVAD